MKVTEHKLPDGRIRLDAVASPAEVQHAFTVAQYLVLQDLGIAVPQGKTPAQVAEEQMKIKDLDAMAAPKAAQYLVPFAIDKRNLVPAFMPTETPIGIKRNQPFEFSVIILPKPQYELEDYGPVTVRVPKAEVPEEAIDEQLAQLLEMHASYETAEPRPLGENDYCVIAMKASKDGEPMPALSTDGRPYVMGMQLMTPDFDQNLLGMQVGETKTFGIPMPGQDDAVLECAVTLKEVQDKVLPELTDEWVKQQFPMLPNADALRESLRQTMLQQVEQQIYQMKVNEAGAAIGRRFKGSIADEIHDATQRALLDDLRMRARMEGMPFDQYVEQMGGQQNFSMMLALSARETLAQGYALDAVFRHEKLKVTDADVAATCRVMNPEDPRAVCREMEDNGRGFALREACERYVANRWLADHAEVEEIEAQ